MIALASFDLETTGVDTENDRIVSGAVSLLDEDGELLDWHEWKVNPEIHIPAEATAVHGITDEMAALGQVPGEAIAEMVGHLRTAIGANLPIVIYNAPFDLSMLDAGTRRHFGKELKELMPRPNVFDPLVLDKQFDRFRKGKRTLVAAAEHYGVKFEGEAHGALADSIAAGRVLQSMLRRFDDLALAASVNPDGVHAAQVEWARSQAESFADYLRRSGKDASDVNTHWPIKITG